MAVLFEVSGSGVGLETWAVLTMVPLASLLTATARVMVRESPRASVSRCQYSVRSLCVLVRGFTLTRVRLTGSVSLTTTFCAFDGPLLSTSSV